MEEKLFIRQSVPFEAGKSRMALPVNVLSTALLEDALPKAIKNENYELASNLRDELNKRKEESEKED